VDLLRTQGVILALVFMEDGSDPAVVEALLTHKYRDDVRSLMRLVQRAPSWEELPIAVFGSLGAHAEMLRLGL
jgi:hypothetical protein